MSVEQLLFIALFVLVPLLNFLARLLRKWMQGQGEPETAHPPAPVPRPVAGPDLSASAAPPPEALAPPRRAVAPLERTGRIPPPVVRRRPPRLRPADVRRGVVLMTILAPCPGLERPARGPRA